jgi:quinoprotein dehydrogenase-associated probable ABC transporter substrate-binding protein
MTRSACAWQRVLTFALTLAALAHTASAQGREIRVCADPNNLPFSNQRHEGFDNKVAKLLADEMKATVRYTWVSHRRGFLRRTLKEGKCDLVMGVPSGFDPVLTTRPYYRSTYVFVYAKSRNLGLRSFDDPALRELKIGLHALGQDGANPPPAVALARRAIVSNVVGYRMWDSSESPPGQIVDAVASGDIDVAIIWGPFAGYFAKRQPIAMEVVPVTEASHLPAVPFEYDISIGVRPEDRAWKEHLEGILERRKGDIRKILIGYGVPLVDAGPGADER